MKKITLMIIVLFSIIELKAQSVSATTPTISVDFKSDDPSILAIFQPTELEDATRGFFKVKDAYLEVVGRVEDQQGIVQFFLNGNLTSIDDNGIFKAIVPLQVGENTISAKVIDRDENVTESFYFVSREEDATVRLEIRGKYYALIIGVNQYDDDRITRLEHPLKDAELLFQSLTGRYTFDKENVKFLKNATYEQIINAFDEVSKKIGPNDNLLVFYAGHGWWDEERELGYWLPKDARRSNTAFWIRNSTISDYIGSIKSKHTLLIADACFSGSIFRTRSAFADAQPSINKLYSLTSRKAMTSGSLKEVPDKSIFLEYMVRRLNDNTEKYLSAEKLFTSFREAVLNNSPNVPQYGTVQSAGDEGGDFIFIRR